MLMADFTHKENCPSESTLNFIRLFSQIYCDMRHRKENKICLS